MLTSAIRGEGGRNRKTRKDQAERSPIPFVGTRHPYGAPIDRAEAGFWSTIIPCRLSINAPPQACGRGYVNAEKGLHGGFHLDTRKDSKTRRDGTRRRKAAPQNAIAEFMDVEVNTARPRGRRLYPPGFGRRRDNPLC
nr:hypothetical protein CFP56_21186 [Quercus suber]